jgi:hypothetical protein
MRGKEHQRTVEKPEACAVGSGRNPQGAVKGAERFASAMAVKTGQETERIMEAVVERGNMLIAYQRVMKNKGAAGVDGLTVEELKPFLNRHWERIKDRLLTWKYIPSPIRKVEIPKPDGRTRMLGIPTVLYRLISQALHQSESRIAFVAGSAEGERQACSGSDTEIP